MTEQFDHTDYPNSRRDGTGGWRAVYRVLRGFVILYAVVWVIRLIMGVGPNLLLRWLGASPNIQAFLGSTLNYGVGIASFIILPAMALRKTLNINPWHILFPLSRGWWKDVIFGFLLVTLVLGLFFGIEVKLGWLVVDGWNWQVLPSDAFSRIAWVGLLVNVGAAIGEEAIFRGYLLTGLKTAVGKYPSVMLMAVIFGLFHLPAYAESGAMRSWTLTLAILLASLFGLLFGLVYLRTGSLWLPTILHFTWNLVENDVLNLTGISNNPHLIGAQTRLHSPLTATGFSLGNIMILETSMFAVIALGVWLWLRYSHQEGLDLST